MRHISRPSSRDTTLQHTESATIQDSLRIVEELSSKYDLDLNQLLELLKNKDKYLAVPLGIFRSVHSPLEALVVFLKDQLSYPFSTIASMLNRDEATIWTTYHNAIKKGSLEIDYEFSDVNLRKLKVKIIDLIIPLNIFSKRQLSILEHLCLYLRDTFGLNYHTIGVLLNRNDRTVWTVIHRAKKKLND